MSPSNERSAEFCRGALAEVRHLEGECDVVFRGDQPHVTRMALCERADELKVLLAAAEAREATPASECELSGYHLDQEVEPKPTAAEVIEAAERALKSCVALIRAEWFVSDVPANESPALECDAADTALTLCARWKEANGGK